MKNKFKHFFIGLIAFIILSGTLLIPKTVHTKDDMKMMEFGYPVAFITQDLTRYDPPFPWSYTFRSVLENSFTISWIRFSLSYLSVFITTELFFVLIESFFKKKHNLTINI